jgi:hypothetical protein
MKPVVRLQHEPSVLLTLAGPHNLHDSDGAGIGQPRAYTYNLPSATAFYGIFFQDCVVSPTPYPRTSFTLVILDSVTRVVKYAEFASGYW